MIIQNRKIVIFGDSNPKSANLKIGNPWSRSVHFLGGYRNSYQLGGKRDFGRYFPPNLKHLGGEIGGLFPPKSRHLGGEISAVSPPIGG